MKIATRFAHAGGKDGDARGLGGDIAISAAYGYRSIESYEEVLSGKKPGSVYSTDGNETTDRLERALAMLEACESAVCTSSGMSAIMVALLACLPERGTVVAAEGVFGGTRRLLVDVLEPLGYEVAWVDLSTPESVCRALESRPRGSAAVFAESVGNPLTNVVDLVMLRGLCDESGATLVVDNTLATPWFCRPADHGAHIIVHSCSKWLGGHTDVVGGVVAGSGAVVDAVRKLMTGIGTPLSPFDSWLVLRGLKTLALRMRQAGANASIVAKALVADVKVSAVHYPGLAESESTRRYLQNGFGSIVSFDLGGNREAAKRFVRGLELIRFVGSFGDVTTTVNHPATTSHRELPPESRARIGVSDGLIRISVGIEDSDDILQDLAAGLSAV